MHEKKGFTLLEVLVSLIILSISFGVIFQTLSQSKRISWRSEDVADAARVAHNLFADTAFIKKALEEGELEGPVGNGEKWHFSVLISPLQLEGKEEGTSVEIPSMLQLKLCLSMHEDSKKRTFCLTRWYRQ